jgi:hypothetical protein
LHDFGIIRDLVQGRTDNLGPHRLSWAKGNRRLPIRRARDDADLVGSILLNGRSYLAQTIDDLFFDLAIIPVSRKWTLRM